MTQNFSVLISLYKRDNPLFLMQSLRSVFSSSLIPSEIVVMLDGPIGDSLTKVIDWFDYKFPRVIKCVPIVPNKGLGNALNLGVRTCKFDIIARMDSDDVCMPSRFEKQFEFLKNNPNIDIVGSSILEFSTEGSYRNLMTYPLSQREIYSFAKKRDPFAHPSVMFRKKAVLDAGNYKTSMRNQQDYELWARMIGNGCGCANLPDVLLAMRTDPEIYGRRGGFNYFKYSYAVEKSKLNSGLTNKCKFLELISIKFIVQVIFTKKIRQLLYRKYLHSGKRK